MTSDEAPSLPIELLEEFTRHGTVKTFPKNVVVVVEGEPAQTLYVVLDGSLVVYVDDEAGKMVELGRLKAGQYFGELMLGSAVRTASVRTITPSRLCMVRRDDFENMLRRLPDLALHVIQTVIYRVKVLTQNVRGLALMDVYGRVARLFLESAQQVDGKYIVAGMSQQAIAERVGASRSMINRILKDLSTGGYIEVRRGQIVLKRGLPKHW
jgi:CRP/FNR family cyclic AMP-dependent transcriptional regulator